MKDQIVTKLKNSNCTKLNKLNCDNSKTQIVRVIKMTVVTEVGIKTSFSKNTLTPLQPTTLRAAIRNSCDVSYTRKYGKIIFSYAATYKYFKKLCPLHFLIQALHLNV